MKQLTLIFLSFIVLLSCDSDNNTEGDINSGIKEVQPVVNFQFVWDSETITNSDISTTTYTNEFGTALSIDRLRYVISDIQLLNAANEIVLEKDYLLIDLSSENALAYTFSEKIPEGSYTLAFRFGFSDDDNLDGAYNDLNTANFNVPGMMGGGYHYMQFDGKFSNSDNEEAPFNYHAIRAVNNSDMDNMILQDTSFLAPEQTVDLTNDASGITITMHVDEWFKNPNTWNLNELSIMLMPNFDAQILMHNNGKNGVF